MYLVIGTIVGLHILSALINWSLAEERLPRRFIFIPIIGGIVFGLFALIAFKIYLKVTETEEIKKQRDYLAKAKAVKYGKKDRKENIQGTLMACLPFIGFLLFTFFPTVLSLVMSVFELHSYDVSMMKFVGLQNFKTLLKSDPFGSTYVASMVNKAFINSLTYCLSVPLRIVVTVFIANFMSKPIKKCVQSPVRVILFLPSLCSSVGVTLMWQWILQADYGIINVLLSKMGLQKINFMGDPDWFWPSVIAMVLWMRATNIINLQAALANVSDELKEAAKLDGATERTVFWKITLPAISPTLFYIITMDLIAALQESGLMQFVTTNGTGPDFKAVTLSYYVYRMAFGNIATDGLGLGCAFAVLIAIHIIVINKINFRVADRWVSYD